MSAFSLDLTGLYATAESRHLFRDFVEAWAQVRVSAETVIVQFGGRAHNPLLVSAGFPQTDVAVP